jgi:uncharacterized protein YebE (UPF0316 family)
VPWYIPLLIFSARICDVSLGTLRIIFIVRQKTAIAAILGFLEVTIWVLAISGTLRHLSNPLALLSYASGFAVGIVAGIFLEKAFVPHFQIVHAINMNHEVVLASRLRKNGYALTEVPGWGRSGDVEICIITLESKSVPRLREEILDLAPDTFITVEDLTDIHGGVQKTFSSPFSSWLRLRKFI